MTAKQALKMAVKVFGKTGNASQYKCAKRDKPSNDGIVRCSGYGAHQQPCLGGLPLCRVGKVEMGMFFLVRGEGLTWEAAFQDAEAKDKADHERYMKDYARLNKG